MKPLTFASLLLLSCSSPLLAQDDMRTAPNGVNYYPVSDAPSSSEVSTPVRATPPPADVPDEKDMKFVSEVTPRTETESEEGPYVAAYGGANFAQDYHDPHADINVTGVETVSADGNSDGGWDAVAGAKFGYNFASFPLWGDLRLQPAIEFDALYLGGHTDNTYGTPSQGAGSHVVVRDNFESAAAFVNEILRLKTGTLFTPYIGIGIGTEYVNSVDSHVSVTNFNQVPAGTNTSGGLSSNEFDFATQVIAGFDLEFAKHWDLFTEYKFITVFSPNLHYDGVDQFQDSLDEHEDFIFQNLITAGLKYNF